MLIKIKLQYSLLFYITLFFAAFSSLSGAALKLTDTMNSVPPAKAMFLYKNAYHDLTLKDVIDKSDRFEPVTATNLNLGHSNDPFWVKIQVNKVEPDTLHYLEIAYPLLDNIEIWFPLKDGSYIHRSGGDHIPFFKGRDINYTTTIWLLPENMPVQSEIYLRVMSQGTLQFPVHFWTTRELMNHIHHRKFLMGIYYGIMLLIIAYNLLLFISLRDINYALYILYVVLYNLAFFSLNGLSFEYLWPNSPVFANYAINLTINAGLAAMYAFALYFLGKSFNRWLRYIMLLMIGVHFIIFSLTWHVAYSPLIRIDTLLIIVNSILMLSAGISSLSRGNQSARFFVIAWVFPLLGTAALAMRNMGLLPNNLLTEFAPQFGAMLEVSLLSFALADRINHMKKDKEKAQNDLANKLREYSTELEQTVQQRTAMLAQSHAEIEQLNRLSREMLGSGGHIDQMLKKVYQFLKQRFGIDAFWLGLVNEEKQELYNHGLYGFDSVDATKRDQLSTLRVKLEPETGTLFKTWQRQRPFYLKKIKEDAEQFSNTDRLIIDLLSLKSMIQIPLIFQQKTIGILCLTRQGEVLDLDKNNLNSLQAFATQISSVLQISQLLEQVEAEKNIADQQHQEAERLLLNILPVEVAGELRKTGHVEPLQYNSVSVLFTDFVGFTEASRKMTPDELVAELDGCFSQFDEIIRRNNLEKLKTIGDSYMCAGGLPVINKSHPLDTCLAALEVRSFMLQMADIKNQLELDFWQLRIGIHTGPVTAGVIGTTKFAYDIWGDTVNTASRMESMGKPGKINISFETWQLVKDYFECEKRKAMNVKGKGEMTMYILNRLRPEYADDAEGLRPNERFRQEQKARSHSPS